MPGDCCLDDREVMQPEHLEVTDGGGHRDTLRHPAVCGSAEELLVYLLGLFSVVEESTVPAVRRTDGGLSLKGFDTETNFNRKKFISKIKIIVLV